ncbi:hypothetical protein EV126DRAFT_229313 [Verticillium dahliae]|nr:hypothetical protein EV126DRAFT_229313 [Verticillium dahliae]
MASVVALNAHSNEATNIVIRPLTSRGALCVPEPLRTVAMIQPTTDHARAEEPGTRPLAPFSLHVDLITGWAGAMYMTSAQGSSPPCQAHSCTSPWEVGAAWLLHVAPLHFHVSSSPLCTRIIPIDGFSSTLKLLPYQDLRRPTALYMYMYTVSGEMRTVPCTKRLRIRTEAQVHGTPPRSEKPCNCRGRPTPRHHLVRETPHDSRKCTPLSLPFSYSSQDRTSSCVSKAQAKASRHPF